MKGKGVLSTALGGMIAGVILFSACGSDGGQAGATEDTVAATPTAAGAVSREMLKSMMPGTTDLPGFTLSNARFLDNEGASTEAPDPAARLASLERMGRVVGFHTIFNRLSKAPPGAPSAILWSVNLFQQPSGALDFVREVPEGLAHQPVDVSTLGPNAVGFAYHSSANEKAASAYRVSFADGVIQVSLTTLYQDAESPPDYTLTLAQQARTLVETALGSPPAPPSLQAEGAAPGPPTATPHTGLTAPLQAGAAEPTPPTATPMGITVPTQAQVGSP